MVFDLRTPSQIKLQSESLSDLTFKKKLDVWEDKPVIVASEGIESNYEPNSAIYRLQNWNKFVHVICTDSPSSARFVFYESSYPF